MCSVLKDPGKCMKIVLVSLAVMEQHSVLSASTRNVPPNFRCLVYHRFLRSSLIRWSLTPLHCTLVSLEVTRRKDLVAGMWGISSPHWIQWSNGAKFLDGVCFSTSEIGAEIWGHGFYGFLPGKLYPIQIHVRHPCNAQGFMGRLREIVPLAALVAVTFRKTSDTKTSSNKNHQK